MVVADPLTAHTSAMTDAEFSHQWLAEGADIRGATDSSCTLAEGDVLVETLGNAA